MTVDFRDYFWGDKHNGYEVLYNNMKYGLVASRELVQFYKERSNLEENNWKILSKVGRATNGGTFTPLLTLLKATVEKLATFHFKMVQKIDELVKDVTTYSEELQRKQKSIKEEGIIEVIQAMQTVAIILQKSRDAFNQKLIEVERLRKDNSSSKEIEKAEKKLKKAHEDYKIQAEKYSVIKEDFETKMNIACKRFQEAEEQHLKQMKEFLTTYAELGENSHDLMGKVYMEFKRQCLEMTVEKLLEQFVLDKYTGLEKPKAPDDLSESFNETTSTVFRSEANSSGEKPKHSRRASSLLTIFLPNSHEKDEAVNSATSAPSSPPTDSTITRQPIRGSKWFLRSRRDKRKGKKNKKKPSDNTEEDRSDNENKKACKLPKPEIDDEGFSVRPKEDTWDNRSSSSSDSDNEKERKIRVEIKPFGTMSASVDELRATVESLSLSPLGAHPERRSHMKRSISQQIGGKADSEVTGVTNLSPTGSSSSTPTHPYAPLKSPTSRYSDLGDIFSEGENGSTPVPPKRHSITNIAIPRPPSRRSEVFKSPTLSYQENFKNSAITISRGPSPLTLGMADTIPLAVAFHEIVHSYFRGTDEEKCQVKLCGDMMLSFPAGIINFLTNNPNPAQLSFKLSNYSNLETVIPNKQLIQLDNKGSNVYEFNMSALSSLLKQQSEQNPTASYFNVDILKYHIKSKPGAESCPLQLVAYWKGDESQTDLKIDYKYNAHSMATHAPLSNLTLAVPVNDGIASITSKPTAIWENQKAIWKFSELSHQCEGSGVGSLRARFSGASVQNTVVAQFDCEGTTLSGIDFILVGSGYRTSLVKRKFVSGKYICEGDFRHSAASSDC